MRTSPAPDLAAVDAALEFARNVRIAKYQRPFLTKEQRRLARQLRASRRSEVLDRRERMAAAPMPIAWSPEVQARFDGYYCEVEARLQREQRHAAVREIMAQKCHDTAAFVRDFPTPPRVEPPHLRGRKRKPLDPLDPRDFAFMAEKLERARTGGHWGTDRETSRVHIRYYDRSGLPLLDPSEARRNAARFGRRLVPELQRLRTAGYLLYYAVASEPNVPAGHLAWGKRNLFRRFRRDIFDALPEIVGAVIAQEDPLSADRQSWNVHLNLILVVDPRRCTPLTETSAEQLDLKLRGAQVLPFPRRAVPVDPTPRGLLSFVKVHHAWGRHQFHIQQVRSHDSETLTRSLREILKYSAKMVPAKSISKRVGSGAGDGHPAGRDRSTASGSAAQLLGAPGAADCPGPDSGRPFELAGRDPQAAPPGLSEYPAARFVEFLEANRRFRRIRTWGCLYELPPDDLPAEPEIRFHGHVRVSSRALFVEAARLSFVSLIHGDKSGRDFSFPPVRSTRPGAREGPDRAS